MDSSPLFKTDFLDVESNGERGVKWIPTRNVMTLTKLLKAFTVHQNWFEKWLALEIHYSHTFVNSENYHPWIQHKKLKWLPLYSSHVMHTSWHSRLFKTTEYICVLQELFQIMHKSIQKLHVRLNFLCLHWCQTEDYHEKNNFLNRPSCKLRFLNFQSSAAYKKNSISVNWWSGERTEYRNKNFTILAQYCKSKPRMLTAVSYFSCKLCEI